MTDSRVQFRLTREQAIAAGRKSNWPRYHLHIVNRLNFAARQNSEGAELSLFTGGDWEVTEEPVNIGRRLSTAMSCRYMARTAYRTRRHLTVRDARTLLHKPAIRSSPEPISTPVETATLVATAAT